MSAKDVRRHFEVIRASGVGDDARTDDESGSTV